MKCTSNKPRFVDIITFQKDSMIIIVHVEINHKKPVFYEDFVC